MTKKNNLKTYYITAKVFIEVNTPIMAESLDDAVAKSKDMRETDFVDIKGDFNDGELRISGVFEEYQKIKL